VTQKIPSKESLPSWMCSSRKASNFIGFAVIEYFHFIIQAAGETAVFKTCLPLVGLV
jgi:hypothetical protein